MDYFEVKAIENQQLRKKSLNIGHTFSLYKGNLHIQRKFLLAKVSSFLY